MNFVSLFSMINNVDNIEERKMLREMLDLGDIDPVKEEEALPADQHCPSCEAPAQSEVRAVLAFFSSRTESQEAKSLSSQDHSWLIIKLAGYHG